MSKDVLRAQDLEYQPLSEGTAAAEDGTTDDCDVSSWSSFNHIGISLVWLVASLHLLMLCVLAHPHLPAAFATLLCVAASVAAVCGAVASLGHLCWRPSTAENPRTQTAFAVAAACGECASMIDAAVAVLGWALTCRLFYLWQSDSQADCMGIVDIGVFTIVVAAHGLICHLLA